MDLFSGTTWNRGADSVKHDDGATKPIRNLQPALPSQSYEDESELFNTNTT
ncbi:hypothetical protein GCM10027565_34530 [Bordetella tumulicola]